MTTTPAHVKAWKRAKHNDDKEAALLNQWFDMRWRVQTCGNTWEGTLSNINYACDVVFTLKVVDPANTDVTLSIEAPFEAPFEQFEPVSTEE